MPYISTRSEVLCKKSVLKFFFQNSQENTCAGFSFLVKKLQPQLEIFKNTFLIEHLFYKRAAHWNNNGRIRYLGVFFVDIPVKVTKTCL